LIIYDLECGNNHKFEGWFKNREACDEQIRDRKVSCPVCGNTQMFLSLSQVSISGIEKRSEIKTADAHPDPLAIMKAIKLYIDRNFDDVGDNFCEVALKIHHGEEDERNIKGVASPSQEEILRDEGVPFINLRVPKFDG
jgi:hypothetical protein